MRGAIAYPGRDGEVTGRVTSNDRLQTYQRWCEETGAAFHATVE